MIYANSFGGSLQLITTQDYWVQAIIRNTNISWPKFDINNLTRWVFLTIWKKVEWFNKLCLKERLNLVFTIIFDSDTLCTSISPSEITVNNSTALLLNFPTIPTNNLSSISNIDIWILPCTCRTDFDSEPTHYSQKQSNYLSNASFAGLFPMSAKVSLFFFSKTSCIIPRETIYSLLSNICISLTFKLWVQISDF